MTRIATPSELATLRRSLTEVRDPDRRTVAVCAGTGCRANGSDEVLKALHEVLRDHGLVGHVNVVPTGCHGFCERGPVVVVRPQGFFYERVTAADVAEIVQDSVMNGEVVERLLHVDPQTGERATFEEDIRFYQKQKRFVLDQNGIIDPTSIEDYIALGGYSALGKALYEMRPEQIIEEISASRLRGRGGAGFATGLKWRFCREAPGDTKYIVCNADEGDPGAYMDRSLMEGNPHRVLEGMMIGAHAIGARHGFVYIRNEYPLAVRHLRTAIDQCREYGLLGEDILGSGSDFSVEIRLGSGAFVCGEETALMASIEGRIGEPRPRPPFPAQSGLWGKPTNINNVETWANVPIIVDRGADWYSSQGTEKSGGTKIFSLVGKINNTGLVEVPIGTALGDIIYDIGGGIPSGKQFKAAQLGGPSGGCIPKQHLDATVDYATLQELGAIMGSGGLVVCDEDTCMVDLARYFLSFVQEESCGKCIPCRVGTRAMLETLERICAGQGREGDIEYLVELATEIKRSALCGLGQTAPNPVLTTIRYFREEYEAHIRDKRCPAGVCQDLFISPCQNACPAGTDVPLYTSLIGEHRFAEAVAAILDTNPFPSVCGRVCHHPCEAKCRRNQTDTAVSIRQLKRFVGDHVQNRPVPSVTSRANPAKVAIIGAGPAGLTCAYFLARMGYEPTVFEKLPVAGGMLAVGIPDYRLPRDVLEREIHDIERLGVQIVTNVSLGKDVTFAQLREQGFQAFFVATGAHCGRRLGIPGEDLKGVVQAVDFLREVNLNTHGAAVSRRVAVVGGGNAAIDAARCALRLGAERVIVLYRRTRSEMPCQAEEVEAAQAEGVEFRFLVAPSAIVGDGGQVRRIECTRMELGGFDRSGRRKPIATQDGVFHLDVDMVIPAISQSSDAAQLFEEIGVDTGAGGLVEADRHGCTSVPGVFAGGDVCSGPSQVINAIAAGEKGAVAIDQYLNPDETREYAWRESKPADTKFDPNTDPVEYPRCEAPALSAASCRTSFREVEGTVSAEAAVREARRCLRCDYRETET